MGDAQVLQAGTPFTVEVTGPHDAHTAVIPVHGFGVRRDARGLFVALERSLPDGVRSFRADYCDPGENVTRAVALDEQRDRLLAVLELVAELPHLQRVVLVGHSQGCLTIGLTGVKFCNIVLLAPPLVEPYTRFIATPGWSRPGSTLNLLGESRLVRSDGSITQVGSSFWPALAPIDAVQLYRELDARNRLLVVVAGADQVLGVEPVPDGLATTTIPGADHDFSKAARQPVLDLVLGAVRDGLRPAR